MLRSIGLHAVVAVDIPADPAPAAPPPVDGLFDASAPPVPPPAPPIGANRRQRRAFQAHARRRA